MNFVYALIVVLLAIFAVAPLEYPGAFQSHSGLSAAYNLIQLDHQGDLGQNPFSFFNWAPTFGTPYDLFRTEGTLPYWVAEIFHRVGFGYLDSIKLVYALAWIASGLTMFALARKFFSESAALLAATVYLYLPFHIATVYVRGAFAESVAWTLFPIALLATFGEQKTDDRKWTFALLPFALLFLTQPGFAILFSLLAMALVVALNWRERNFSRGIGTIGIGLGVGAALTLLVWARYGARIAPGAFTPDFVLPFQLFASTWGYALQPVTSQTSQGTIILDQFPFQLGVVAVGLAIIAVALNWRATSFDSATLRSGWAAPTRRVITIFLFAAIGMTLLTFGIAAPIWSTLGIFAAYPWQLLAFVGMALAFVAGSVIDLEPRWSQPAMVAFFVALPVIASYGYLAPRYIDFSPTRPQIAIYGNNEIALLDYRIVGPLRHGATVRIELKWQALRQIDRDYTVFVHAIDESGKTWAQDDNKPQDDTLPTIKWMPGQIIFDMHTIQIDIDGPREGYHLEFGLYQAASGERAVMQNGADVLILPRPGDPPPTVSDQLPPDKQK